MENPKAENYREAIADQMRSSSKDERKELWEQIKNTPEYQAARQKHKENIIEQLSNTETVKGYAERLIKREEILMLYEPYAESALRNVEYIRFGDSIHHLDNLEERKSKRIKLENQNERKEFDNEAAAVLERIKGSTLIDLGCGVPYGPMAKLAAELNAGRYIGIEYNDYFRSPRRPLKSEETEGRIKKEFNCETNFDFVPEEMLTALSKINIRANFTINGIDDLIIINNDFLTRLATEIIRLTPVGGVVFGQDIAQKLKRELLSKGFRHINHSQRANFSILVKD